MKRGKGDWTGYRYVEDQEGSSEEGVRGADRASESSFTSKLSRVCEELEMRQLIHQHQRDGDDSG